MNNETMPEKASPEVVYSIDEFANGEAGEWQTDHCDRPSTTYFREDVVEELKRQNAALKAFVMSSPLNSGWDMAVTTEAVKAGIIDGEEFEFRDWMTDDTAKMPTPSKAEVAREFSLLLIREIINSGEPALNIINDVLKEWEDGNR